MIVEELIPNAWLPVVALFARCFGCTLLLPFGDSLTTIPRLILTMGLACGLLPLVDAPTVVDASGSNLMIALIVAEFVTGLLLTTPMRVLAEVAELFGEILDTVRGQTIGSVQDPLNGQMSSDLASIARISTVVFVMQLGGLEALTITLGKSFDVLPLGAHVGALSTLPLESIMTAAIEIVVSALRLAMVWIFGFICVDISCAVAARLVSGFSFSTIGGMTKTCMTFGLLLVLVHEVMVAPPGWLLTFIASGLNY